MFDKTRSFLVENGSYVFWSAIADRSCGLFRNRMLARHLRVKKVNIGPRSFLRGLAHVEMGEDFSAGEGLWLEAVTKYNDESFKPKLVIGNHVRVSHWSHIACTSFVSIGDNVLIGSKVLITDHNHGVFGAEATSPTMPPAMRPLERDRSVIIGPNVWLGDGVVICPGVTMGEGSVAGANAVVTVDVPPYTLVAGVPGRTIQIYDPVQQHWIKP